MKKDFTKFGVYAGVVRKKVHAGRIARLVSCAWVIRQVDGKQKRLLEAVYFYAGSLCIGLLTHWTWKNIKHDYAK